VDDARRLTGGGTLTLDEDGAMARAATRDPRAFAAIYERHRTPIYRYLRSRTMSDDEAGELSAVTFERALAAIHRFRPSGGGMVAWLLRIARNAQIDAGRRITREAARPGGPGADTSIGTAPGLEDSVVLRNLIQALPGNQRDAIQLRSPAG
jgi:RNA polymerase sigma-70 factor (ECF subfamily)